MLQKILKLFLLIIFVPLFYSNAFFLENNPDYLILNWHDHFCSYLNLKSIHVFSNSPERTELRAEIITHDFDYGYNVGFTSRYIYDQQFTTF